MEGAICCPPLIGIWSLHTCVGVWVPGASEQWLCAWSMRGGPQVSIFPFLLQGLRMVWRPK